MKFDDFNSKSLQMKRASQWWWWFCLKHPRTLIDNLTFNGRKSEFVGTMGLELRQIVSCVSLVAGKGRCMQNFRANGDVFRELEILNFFLLFENGESDRMI
jgi:hypothetical protein